jgi:hypothetical protein
MHPGKRQRRLGPGNEELKGSVAQFCDTNQGFMKSAGGHAWLLSVPLSQVHGGADICDRLPVAKPSVPRQPCDSVDCALYTLVYMVMFAAANPAVIDVNLLRRSGKC